MNTRSKIFLASVAIALAFPHSAYSARVKCADFKNQKQAQKYFEAKRRGYKSLDRDKDGKACECLPGGSAYHKSVCKRFRKKYGF